MKIIGVSGKAGSGKDWLFEHVLRPRGYVRWPFALPMKAAAYAKGFTVEEIANKPPHVREWLQRYGTEEHREKYGEDWWVRMHEAYVDFLSREIRVSRIAVCDVRFPNEAAYIKRKGGSLVRMLHAGRPYPLKGTPAAEHPSETALDAFEGWDAVVNNYPGQTAGRVSEHLARAGLFGPAEKAAADVRAAQLRFPLSEKDE